jgi:hypothetical protein
MKRTVRLASLSLNQGKLEALKHVACSYAEAKGVFVDLLRPFSMWHYLEDKRGFRNWAKQQGFYPSGMNVHLVDQAAFDAVDTCVRHIASVVATANIEARVSRRFSNKNERHYAYACLGSYKALGVIMRGATPDLRAGNLSKESRQVVARYLHRILRAALKNTWPRVHLARSFALEEGGHYRSFVIEGSDTIPRQRQYVAVVGVEKGKRIVIPLAGISRVSGNIRLVLDETGKRAFVHVAYEMHPLPRTARGPEKAIDWGSPGPGSAYRRPQ